MREQDTIKRIRSEKQRDHCMVNSLQELALAERKFETGSCVNASQLDGAIVDGRTFGGRESDKLGGELDTTWKVRSFGNTHQSNEKDPVNL